MEIKVGMWARKNKHIGEVTDVNIGGYHTKCKTLRNPFNYVDSLYYKEWNVANTPQELVIVGDLVGLRNSKTLEYVIFVGDGIVDTNIPRDEFLTVDYITKIFTPNNDKTQYILQWEAK